MLNMYTDQQLNEKKEEIMNCLTDEDKDTIKEITHIISDYFEEFINVSCVYFHAYYSVDRDALECFVSIINDGLDFDVAFNELKEFVGLQLEPDIRRDCFLIKNIENIDIPKGINFRIRKVDENTISKKKLIDCDCSCYSRLIEIYNGNILYDIDGKYSELNDFFPLLYKAYQNGPGMPIEFRFNNSVPIKFEFESTPTIDHGENNWDTFSDGTCTKKQAMETKAALDEYYQANENNIPNINTIIEESRGDIRIKELFDNNDNLNNSDNGPKR